MTIFLVAVAFLFLSSLAGSCTGRGGRFMEKLCLISALAGSVLGFIATLTALLHPANANLVIPWSVPGGALALRIDGLSAVFLLPAFIITATGALYGAGYWPVRPGELTGIWWRSCYGIMAGAIVLVFAADNAVLFLIAWEVMALAAFFLVATERAKREAHEASILYLIATHTGTLALFGMFAIITTIQAGNIVLFPSAGSLDGATSSATVVFLLALCGFGIKAGIMPMHIWLPQAHAAVPSHVSALMSGVLIKTGIYGLMRVTSMFNAIPAWWGWTVLGLGVVSGVLGVVLALAQHDIKRLLAFHSVENIGIILIGFGAALLGRACEAPAVMVLGAAGALLHVVNHGLFKALLFYAAGSVIHATGTREMARYGGLLRSLPITGVFFLGGAVAICGLPPMNGFVSEWLVYLGLIQTLREGAPELAVAVFAAPGLAFVGGLALLCFTKVFGLCFLGEMRHIEQSPHEVPYSMLTAMAILLTACLGIGLTPAGIMPLLARGVRDWAGLADLPLVHQALAPIPYISLFACLLLFALGGLCFFTKRKDQQTAVPTWGCGYLFVNQRMQYSTASFAQMLVDIFQWALRGYIRRREIGNLFRREASFVPHTPDATLDLMVLPGFRSFAMLATRVRRIIQHGMMPIYILYAALTLCGLMLLTLR